MDILSAGFPKRNETQIRHSIESTGPDIPAAGAINSDYGNILGAIHKRRIGINAH